MALSAARGRGSPNWSARGDEEVAAVLRRPAPAPMPKSAFCEAVLDSSQLTELVEGMGDVLAAASSLTLRFRVAVEFADGENATPDVAAKLSAALDKLGVRAS